MARADRTQKEGGSAVMPMSARRSVPGMTYHHVSPSSGTGTTSPKNFESQLAWLKRFGYRTLTSMEFAAHLDGKPAPRRSVLITFDDGYLDNWVYAYPLLKKYGFNAVLFVVTSWVGDGPARPHMGQGALPMTPSHRVCGELIEQGRKDDVILRWSEIRAMQEAGVIEFHSHTHTHTRWDKHGPDGKLANIERELRLSRQALSDNLGVASEHFCWPQGYFEPEYLSVARDAGYRYLYTTRPYGQNRPGSDPNHIFRFDVRNRRGDILGQRLWVAAHPVVGSLYNRWQLWKRRDRSHA
jgi:peptidoglycan/xylan/chitin deacetylase (PgdA/CDA1 family)